jgi:general secretion pathway protein G
MSTQKKQTGFTLIEIMVVVVILGILALLVVPKVMDRPDEAKLVKVQQDIQAIQTALNLYRLDNHVYPSTEEGLEKLVDKYLDQVPVDPWQREYLYISPGLHGDFDIFTEGADGVEGGEGVKARIGNWNK